MASDELGIRLENVTLEMLGAAKRVTLDADETTLIDGAGSAADMTFRSKRSSVTSGAPLRLVGFDAPERAGTYPVDADEEALEANARTVSHRTATTLLVDTTGRVEHRAVDPKDREAALLRDGEVAALLPQLPPPEAPVPSMTPPVRGRWVPLWIRVPWSGRGV